MIYKSLFSFFFAESELSLLLGADSEEKNCSIENKLYLLNRHLFSTRQLSLSILSVQFLGWPLSALKTY